MRQKAAKSGGMAPVVVPESGDMRGMSSRAMFVTVLAVALVATAGYFWWHRGGAAAGGAGGPGGPGGGGGLPAEVATARTDDVARTLQVVGQLEAADGAVLRSEVSARVAKVYFKEGQKVAAGAVLMVLDDRMAQASLAQAQADLALKRSNVGRYTRLRDSNAVSPLQLEQAQAEAKRGEANAQYALATLEKYRIKAPFDGVAGIAQVNVGETVQPGDALVAVTNNDVLEVTFKVPETEAAGMVAGLPVTLRSDNGVTAEGTVTALDGRIDPTTRTLEAKLELDNREHRLLAGQFVRVSVPVQRVQGAVVIPDVALVPQGGKVQVWVVGEGNKVSPTEVQVGVRGGNMAEIKAGLRAGQRVVVAGQQKLQPGMPVTPLSPTEITPRPSAVETLQQDEQ